MRKPVDIVYGGGETPPPAALLSAAVQQTVVILVFVYPALIIARAVGASPADAASMIALTVLACGASALIQAVRGGIGCGFLAPATASAAFLGPSLLAVQMGGPGLMAGMTIAAGVATVLLAPLLHRIRSLLPPEIAGVAVLIIGIAISVTGVRMLLVMPDGGPPAAESLVVAAGTLLLAGGLSVWGRGVLRWACVLIAMAAGSLLAAWLGLLENLPVDELAALPAVGLPQVGGLDYAFDASLLPAFLIAALANTLKTVGLVTSLQKLNDADWVRPAPRGIAAGVTGDGLTAMLCGLVAAPVVTMSATNISIQAAAGVTSRAVAFATAAICALLACFPRATAILAQVPAPVIAAVLLHAGGLMLVSGMQLASSRLFDARRSLGVGLALVAALAVEALPRMAQWVPAALQPMMSAAALGTLVAIVLNAALRIGIRRRATLTVPVAAISEAEVADFTLRAGASWGARREVVLHAADLVSWSLDAVVGAGLARGAVTVTLAFDELQLDVLIAYAGPPVALSDTLPTADELLSDSDAPLRLAGHMIRRRAHRAAVWHRDGQTELRLSLEH